MISGTTTNYIKSKRTKQYKVISSHKPPFTGHSCNRIFSLMFGFFSFTCFGVKSFLASWSFRLMQLKELNICKFIKYNLILVTLPVLDMKLNVSFLNLNHL